MTFSVHTPVGRYQVTSLLGRGGMGEVYLARDNELERNVAIKVLSAEFVGDADKLARFFQEAKAASALNHPNILTVYEIGKHEDSHFIVTEHIEGKTLTEYIKTEKPDIRRLLELASQIVSALAAAHEAGIVHRDIKPGNIMVRSDRIVKVLDFGLAKLTKLGSDDYDSEAKTLAKVTTLPGMLLGTPSYMSPEQARAQELDSRTDIFSFGIVLFEMIAGHRPFLGESYADIMGAVLKDEPPPLSRYFDNISPDLEQIVAKTLRKDRESRYQNTKDLLIDLKDLRDHLKFEEKLSHSSFSGIRSGIHGTNADQVQETVQIDTRKTYRWYSALIPAAALVVVALVGIIGIWWYAAGNSGASSPANLKTKDIVSWNSAPGELSITGRISPDGSMIAFAQTQTDSKDIWIKKTGEGGAAQVTKDKFTNKDPVWSPNGNEIAYFSDKGNNTATQSNATGIWRIPMLGGNPVSVGPVEDGSSQLRLWSKSGLIYYESSHNLFAITVETGVSKKISGFDAKDQEVRTFSVSTDEKRMAYVRNADALREIFVSPLTGGEPVKVTSVESEINSLIWHPNNEELLYSTLVDGTYQIFSVKTNGSEPVQVTFGDRNSSVVDVAADGSSVLFSSAKEESNLWQVIVETANESNISSGMEAELWPAFSPAGDRLAFQSVKNLSQGDKLLSGSIVSKVAGTEGQPAKMADNGFLPTWSPDGNVLAFMRLNGPDGEIWTVNSAGGQPTKLASGGISSIGYSVSPYNRVQSKDFDWRPDGSGIVYVANRGGSQNIWQSSLGGKGDNQLTQNKETGLSFYCPVWSEDGKFLAFFSKSQTTDESGKSLFQYWVYDVETNQTNKVFETTNLSRLVGWASPNSDLLIVGADKYSGLPPAVHLSKVDIKTGKQLEIASLNETYYYNIQISPDKTHVAFVSNRDGKDNIWIIRSGGGEPRQISNNNDANLYFSSLSWSADGKAIFFGKQTRYSLLSMITNFQ